MAERTGPPGADPTSQSAGSIASQEAADDTGAVLGEPGAARLSTPLGPPCTVPSERYYAMVVERIGVLAAVGFNAPTIAQTLAREGYTMAPGRSDPISLTTVRRLLRENLSAAGRRPVAVRREGLAAHEWWLQDLAAELSMPSVTLYGWARRGWVTVVRKESRPPYRLVLHADPAETERLRARRLRVDQEGLRVGTVPIPHSRGGAPQYPDTSAVVS